MRSIAVVDEPPPLPPPAAPDGDRRRAIDRREARRPRSDDVRRGRAARAPGARGVDGSGRARGTRPRRSSSRRSRPSPRRGAGRPRGRHRGRPPAGDAGRGHVRGTADRRRAGGDRRPCRRRRALRAARRASPSASARSCRACSAPRRGRRTGAVGVYFVLGSGSDAPSGGQFQAARRAGELQLPERPRRAQAAERRAPQAAFSTAVGVDGANYVVVATYSISADVQPDGSAIGSGGSRLTADRFDESVDRAAERIAAAQKLKPKGPRAAGQGRRPDRPHLRLHAARRQQRALRVRVPRAHRVLDRVLLGSRARRGAERRLRPGHDDAAARGRLTPSA